MTRRRSLLSQVQRDSYLISRTAGDVRAAGRGPAPLARRYAHRVIARAVFRALRSTFR